MAGNGGIEAGGLKFGRQLVYEGRGDIIAECDSSCISVDIGAIAEKEVIQ